MSRQSLGGTRLTLGIPCIVAPKDSRGKPQRFRAVVKYIGPLSGRSGSWVGVEIPEVSLTTSSSNGFIGEGFNDGSLNGIRYFDLGENHKDKETDQDVDDDKIRNDDVDSFRKPEREARKRRIARMIGNTSTLTNSNHLKDNPSSTSSSPSLIRNSSSVNSLRSSGTNSKSQSDWSEDESSLLPSAKKRKDLKGLV
ncbi:hypothetical protein L7F22_063421 [Adiantum nelumboides]|nr:hypothetical protein [Adiantum nelumboides]